VVVWQKRVKVAHMLDSHYHIAFLLNCLIMVLVFYGLLFFWMPDFLEVRIYLDLILQTLMEVT
jgi:hypothetical protein